MNWRDLPTKERIVQGRAWEFVVGSCIFAGNGYKDIATRFGIPESKVCKCVSRLYKRVGVSNRADFTLKWLMEFETVVEVLGKL